MNYTGQTSKQIHDSFNVWLRSNLGSIIQIFLDGKLVAFPQKSENATWVNKRTIKDCMFDFNFNAPQAAAFLKALVPPYPLPRLSLDGKVYLLDKADIVENIYVCSSGAIVGRLSFAVLGKFMGGLLRIEVLTAASTGIRYEGQSLLDLCTLGKRFDINYGQL